MSNANVFPIEPLSTVRKRITEGMRNAELGPMLIADDIIVLSNNWMALYSDQSDGMTLQHWLRYITTHHLAWFISLRDAVATLGPDVKRWMSHGAVRWVANNVEADHHKELKARCFAHHIKNNRVPLSLMQAKRVAAEMGIRPTAKKAECERCALLESLLEEHGIEVPSETPPANE